MKPLSVQELHGKTQGFLVVDFKVLDEIKLTLQCLRQCVYKHEGNTSTPRYVRKENVMLKAVWASLGQSI